MGQCCFGMQTNDRRPQARAGEAELCREFLKQVMVCAKQPVFLNVDGQPIHKAKSINESAAAQNGKVRVFTPPPYSQQLNPDEQVWAHVKRQVSRQPVQSKDEMKWRVLRALCRIQKLPKLVKSFFFHPECRCAFI